MPVLSSSVGTTTPAVTVTCDRRSLMAYAAGIGDRSPTLYDTTSVVPGHPLFTVSSEWQLFIAERAALSPGLSRGERLRGVHAAHSLLLHRPIHDGDEVLLTAEVAAVDHHRSGAAQHIRFRAIDRTGEPWWTTIFSMIYRGVELQGEPSGTVDIIDATAPPGQPSSASPTTIEMRVSATDAHVYTECARIYNPIHTDLAVAREAGLERPVLHGTATLARSVSAIAELVGRPVCTVDRVGGSFKAVVPIDSTVWLHVDPSPLGDAASFSVLDDAGRRAIDAGTVRFRRD